MDIRKLSKYSYQIYIFLVGFILGLLIYSLLSSTTVNYTVTPVQNNNLVYMQNKVIFPLVAVSSSGEGILEYATLSYTNGNGGIFTKINPFVEPDTQYVLENAIYYVCDRYGFECKNKDFYLEINSTAQLVGGPSAGLAFALAAYYLLNNESFPSTVAATGAIDRYGRVYKVGGIIEKALAAAKNGKKIFIVPKGQSIVYHYEKVERTRELGPGFYITEIYYKPVPINISEYLYNKYGMYVFEVSSVDEAISLINSIKK